MAFSPLVGKIILDLLWLVSEVLEILKAASLSVKSLLEIFQHLRPVF
jgi:hypothetical protein